MDSGKKPRNYKQYVQKLFYLLIFPLTPKLTCHSFNFVYFTEWCWCALFYGQSVSLIQGLVSSFTLQYFPLLMYMCYHLISESTIFRYPDEFLTDITECERSELQRFCSKNVSLRRYGSFNSLIVLCHLESLTKKIAKINMQFNSQTHKEFLYLYNESSEASV